MLFSGSQAAAGWPWDKTATPLTAEQVSQLLAATGQRADTLLSRSEISPYRGWLKYLHFRAERERSRAGVSKDISPTDLLRFTDWVRQIESNPNVLGTLRGIQEWAYESSADNTGQPFLLNIPTDYKPSRPPGLLVNLHAAMGDHHQWMAPHKGMFELAVLGRSRLGGYEGLAEADVLQATRLRLRLTESPFDRKKPLRVSVNRAEPFDVPAPLAESLVLVSGPRNWEAETKSELRSFRLHTPGGPKLLYDGSPLLIVYGTRGDSNLCEAMRAAAEAASKSSNPAWNFETSPVDAEGVPYSQMLYGRLKTKADSDVTEADLQQCHLICSSLVGLISRAGVDVFQFQALNASVACEDIGRAQTDPFAYTALR